MNLASSENVLGLPQKFVKCQHENFNWVISNISSLNDLLLLLITYHPLLLPPGWQFLIYSFFLDDIICPWVELTKALYIQKLTLIHSPRFVTAAGINTISIHWVLTMTGRKAQYLSDTDEAHTNESGWQTSMIFFNFNWLEWYRYCANLKEYF